MLLDIQRSLFLAIPVSQDMTLRQSIRKSVMEHSKLMDSIGTAKMEKKILLTATDIKERMSQEAKVEGKWLFAERKLMVDWTDTSPINV